jgi:long-chain acyl-CoA synthetase
MSNAPRTRQLCGVINNIASGRLRRPSAVLTIHSGQGRRSMSLQQLSDLAWQAAAYLRSIGIQEGERIGVSAKNSLEWVLLDLAAIRIKAVIAGFEADRIPVTSQLIEDYGLAILFTDRPEAKMLGDARIKQVGEILPALEWFDTSEGQPGAIYQAGEHTTIKFTSGSTGAPKGLAATVGSIDSSVSAVQELFDHRDTDKLFVFLPLSLLQQRYWIYSALTFGHDIVVSTMERAFVALREEEPTVVMGVPGFFETLRQAIEEEAAEIADQGGQSDDLPKAAQHLLGRHVRYLWTGSAPASPSVLDFFEMCGVPLLEGYGMNEVCIVTKNTLTQRKKGSVGRPLPGKHISVDENGVIVVGSDYPVNVSYMFCAPGDSEKIFRPDGSVVTGDLGHIDEDGFLFVLGRADDVVSLQNGRNVMVRTIEERLKCSPAIANCIVYASPNGGLGAIICTAGEDHCQDLIKKHLSELNSTSADHERIDEYHLVAEKFSVENGLLTSQFKPRRQAILQKHLPKQRNQ